MTRTQLIEAKADPHSSVDGVAVVGSFRSSPPTMRPWRVRGIAHTDKTNRYVTVALTQDEAVKLVADFLSLGGKPFYSRLSKWREKVS